MVGVTHAGEDLVGQVAERHAPPVHGTRGEAQVAQRSGGGAVGLAPAPEEPMAVEGGVGGRGVGTAGDVAHELDINGGLRRVDHREPVLRTDGVEARLWHRDGFADGVRRGHDDLRCEVVGNDDRSLDTSHHVPIGEVGHARDLVAGRPSSDLEVGQVRVAEASKGIVAQP